MSREILNTVVCRDRPEAAVKARHRSGRSMALSTQRIDGAFDDETPYVPSGKPTNRRRLRCAVLAAPF